MNPNPKINHKANTIPQAQCTKIQTFNAKPQVLNLKFLNPKP